MPLTKQRGFKFSILCDVFLLLSAVVLMVRTIEIVPGIFNENDLTLIPLVAADNRSDRNRFDMAARFDSYNDFTNTPAETIHRILRDEEPAAAVASFRSEDDTELSSRRSKRSTDAKDKTLPEINQLPNPSSANSTKSLDLVNSNLTKFEIDKDLELHLKQSQDHQAIKRLNLTDNRLSVFDTKVLRPLLTTVVTLDLSQNNLTTFVLANRSELTYVNLSGNKLSSFRVDGTDTKLNILSLHNNKLRATATNTHTTSSNENDNDKFDLSPVAKLETLDLSCNEINQVNRKLIGHGSALKRLNLSRNRLLRIDRDMFYNLLNLETLVLSYNNITTIDAETFLLLPNLQYLDLSYNNIRPESIRSLQGIPDLVGLSIAYNPDLGDAALQEFVASWSLKELDASGTGLCRIPSALAQSVRTLVLVDNWFEIIRGGDLDSYPLLQYLDLSNSHITEIEDDAIGRLEILETLFLDHNHLRRIPVSLPPSLENLFLQNNDIMDIQSQSLQQLTNLKTLDLSANKLTYVPGLPLPKLLVLNLQSSGVRGLSQSVVKMSPRLTDLLLDGNPIKCTELMSIAEWATACQQYGRVPSKLEDIKRRFIQVHDYLNGFPGIYQPNESDNDECRSHNSRRADSVKEHEIRRPLCAVVDVVATTAATTTAAQSKKDIFDSNKLEMQFNKTIENKPGNMPFNRSLNQSEDIENFIEMPRSSSFHASYHNQSENLLAINRISGKADYVASTATNRESLSSVPNDTKIEDKLANSSTSDNSPVSNAKKDQSSGPVDAKTSVTMPSPSQVGSMSGSNFMFTKSKKNSKQKQHRGMISMTRMRSVEAATTSVPTIVDGISNVDTGEEQISSNSHHDKLDQTESSPVLQKLLQGTQTNDSVRDKGRTEKMMKSAISQKQVIGMKTTTGTTIASTTTLVHDSPNDKAVLLTHVSHRNISAIATLSPTTTTTTTTTTRPPTKTMSSKVNKADKVVDQQPSAINENGIMKSNHSSTPNNHQQRQTMSAHGTTTETRSHGEKLLWPKPKLSDSVPSLGNKRYYHDISQQNEQTVHHSTTTTPLTTITPKKPLSDKVKDDKHLKFIGAKNLNVTVLTYTKEQQQKQQQHQKQQQQPHIHKTINRDIALNYRPSSVSFGHHQQSDSTQLFSELETRTPNHETFIDFQSTISPSNQSTGGNHLKVNTERIVFNSMNNLISSNKTGDLHPQLNALHALTPQHLNASHNGSNGLPPERWLGIRTGTGHPGLFIIIGLTIGIICTLGLLHIYRCRRPKWRRRSHHQHHPYRSRHQNSTLSTHCCNTDEGITDGADAVNRNRREPSPDHLCDYSFDDEDDADGYYIEPDHNRIRSSSRRDFLPMELLRPSNMANIGHQQQQQHHRRQSENHHSIW